MNKSMMIRTNYTKVLGAVILYLGNRLNMVHFNNGECCGGITPFVCSGSSSVAILYLAFCSHQTNDQLP